MPISQPPPRTRSAAAALLAPLAVAAVCAVFLWTNFDKAAWWGIQGWGRPYWWLDYHHGFVRRGLIGELFQLGFGRLDEAHLAAKVAVIHRLFCFALAAMALFILVRALQAQRSAARFAVVGAVGLWLVVGEVWPTLAYNQGYLDVIVLVLAVAAALLVRRGWSGAAAVLAFAGPFIHEYFLFLTPFILAADRSFGLALEGDAADGSTLQSFDTALERAPVPRGVLVVGGAALLATLIATFGPSLKASGAEIAAMTLSAQDREILVRTTMGQTFSQSFSGSAGLLVGNLGFALKNFALLLPPALVASAGLLFWRRPPIPLSRWVRVVAGLAPLAALLVAWDFSRLTVNAGLTAGLLFLMTAEDDPGETAASPSAVALAGVGALVLAGMAYVLVPFAYIYYPPGPTTLFPLKSWPADGHSTFGAVRLWPGAQIHPVVNASSVNIRDLNAAWPGARLDSAGLHAPAGADGLLFFGPYAWVDGGRREARVHLVLSGSPQACRAAASELKPRIRVTGRAGAKVLAAEQPATVTPEASDPCRVTITSAPFDAGAFGERDVETPLTLALPLPALVDGYALPAAHSR